MYYIPPALAVESIVHECGSCMFRLIRCGCVFSNHLLFGQGVFFMFRRFLHILRYHCIRLTDYALQEEKRRKFPDRYAYFRHAQDGALNAQSHV